MPNYREITRGEIMVGMSIEIVFDNGAGRGIDKVLSVDPDGTLRFVTGSAEHRKAFPSEQYSADTMANRVRRIMVAEPIPLSECIEFGSDCAGPCDEHSSRSGLTSAIRCESHYRRHSDRMDAIDRRYPDSEFAPSWFDPAYAGESWNGDY